MELVTHKDLILEMQKTKSCAQIADHLALEFGIIREARDVQKFLDRLGVKKVKTIGNKANPRFSKSLM